MAIPILSYFEDRILALKRELTAIEEIAKGSEHSSLRLIELNAKQVVLEARLNECQLAKSYIITANRAVS